MKLDNFYSNTFHLRLIWVRYCFFGALVLVTLVIISMFISNPYFGLFITGINILFYTFFGLLYIQYPLTYTNLESLFITSSLPNNEELNQSSGILSWDKLKSLIVEERYYIRPEINIEEMAQYLKVGRTTLSAFINKEEKMNFHAWINSLRIQEAQQIFESNPDYSITQVAEMIGFSEVSHFSRQFKQITNESPSAWKQKLK